MTLLLTARRRGSGVSGGGGGVTPSNVELSYYNPNSSTANYTSSGIPLQPGMLTASQFDAGYGRVEVNGVEVTVYAERLYGRHADNSLRSILVQCAKADVQAGTVVFYTNRLRTLSPRTKQTVTRTYLQAPLVLLPSSASYLCDTDLCFAPLCARGTESALNADYSTLKSSLATYGDGAWSVGGVSAWPAGTTYDHGLTLAIEWCETANPTIWWRAMQIIDAMTDAITPQSDAVANPTAEYGTVTWGSSFLPAQRRMAYSTAVGYALTGHTQMRQSILAVMEFNTNWVNPDYRLVTDSWSLQSSEPRTAMALLPSLVLGILLEAPNNTNFTASSGNGVSENWQYRLTSLLNFFASTIRPAAAPLPYCAGIVYSNKDYSGGSPLEAGNFPTFMLGVTCSDLIAAYRYCGQDSRILTWLDSMATFMVNQTRPVDPSVSGYVSGSTTFNYNTADPSTLGSTIANADWMLALMMGTLFGFLGYTNHDATRISNLQTFVRSQNYNSYLGGAVWKFYSEQALWSAQGIGYHRKYASV